MVASRIGLRADAVAFEREDDLERLIRDDIAAHGKLDCVLVDEAQFLTRAQVWQLSEVVDALRIPVLCYGLRTDFQGEGAFNLKINHSRHWLTPGGTEWRNQLEIGDTTAAHTELYHPWGGERDRFVSAHIGVSKRKQMLYSSSKVPVY